MTKKERQKQLDEQKWLKSEAEGSDQSGKMEYCRYCTRRTFCGSCLASQESREKASLCARAYSRLKR